MCNRVVARLKYKENTSKVDEKKLKKHFSSEFGKYIQKVRKEQKLTQEDLAYKTNLHSTYIGHIETGTYTPSIFVVWKIAQVLKMDLKELLKGF